MARNYLDMRNTYILGRTTESKTTKVNAGREFDRFMKNERDSVRFIVNSESKESSASKNNAGIMANLNKWPFSQLPKHQTGITPVFRRYILAEDPLCLWCKIKPATTVDHVRPKSRGGSNNLTNLVGCCPECNNLKAHFLPSELGWKLRLPKRAMLLANKESAKALIAAIRKYKDPIFDPIRSINIADLASIRIDMHASLRQHMTSKSILTRIERESHNTTSLTLLECEALAQQQRKAS